MTIAESQAAAMERLRLEFVQRASRSASGSLLEEHLANAISARLQDLLPYYDGGAEPLLLECFQRIESVASQWTNNEINIAVNRQSFNALWEIPSRLNAPTLLIDVHGLS